MYTMFRLTATVPNASELFTTELSYDWMLSIHREKFIEALNDYMVYGCPIVLPFRIGSYVGEGVFTPIG